MFKWKYIKMKTYQNKKILKLEYVKIKICLNENVLK